MSESQLVPQMRAACYGQDTSRLYEREDGKKPWRAQVPAEHEPITWRGIHDEDPPPGKKIWSLNLRMKLKGETKAEAEAWLVGRRAFISARNSSKVREKKKRSREVAENAAEHTTG